MKLISAVIIALCCAAPAVAAPLAQTSSSDALSAHGGWVVWNDRVDGAHVLMASRDGVVTRLPVPARPLPFDVDLGTDEQGRTVATYSRCVDATQGTGCVIFVLDLETGEERVARIPQPSGASHHSPSMWRGKLAYVRRRAGARVEQLMLWSPAARRTRRLPHGTVSKPELCKGGKPCRPFDGLARELDLGDRVLAYVWDPRQGIEVRAVRLSGGRSRLLGRGFAGEICLGSRGVVDVSDPLGPVVDGDRVSWTTLEVPCDERHRSFLTAADSRTGKATRTTLGPGVVRLARDGAVGYALVDNDPGFTYPPCTGRAACTIERLE